MSFGVVGEDSWGTVAEQAAVLGVEPETLLAIVKLLPGTHPNCSVEHLILLSQAKCALDNAVTEAGEALKKL